MISVFDRIETLCIKVDIGVVVEYEGGSSLYEGVDQSV